MRNMVFESQIGFMLGRKTREVIFLLRCSTERYRHKQKDFIYGVYKLGKSLRKSP